MAAEYMIYTKPGCAHCERAKAFLTAKGIEFTTAMLDSEALQLEFLAKLKGWRTWPAIFALSSNGVPVRFVGGASELIVAVNADHDSQQPSG